MDTGFVAVGAGAVIPFSGAGHVVGAPTVLTLGSPIQTRFLRIEARTAAGFIELRAVKAFGSSP